VYTKYHPNKESNKEDRFFETFIRRPKNKKIAQRNNFGTNSQRLLALQIVLQPSSFTTIATQNLKISLEEEMRSKKTQTARNLL